MNNNTKRFFQIGSNLLMEYEMNDVYNHTRTDEYGDFIVGDYIPVLMKLKDGSYLTTNTIDDDNLKHNNLYNNISLNYDDTGSMYFHFEDNATIDNYIQMNKKFGVSEPVKMYVSVNTAERMYDDIYNDVYIMLANKIEEYEEIYGPLDDIGFDANIVECIRGDEFFTKTLLGIIKDNHTGEYIYRYYDDSLHEEMLSYETCFEHLINDGLDYYEGTSREQCVKYSLVAELWAFKKMTKLSYILNETEMPLDTVKFETLDYSSYEIKKTISNYMSIAKRGIDIVSTSEKIPYDKYRIYFVGGYYMNDMYGFHLKLSTTREDTGKLILSDVLYNKESDIEFKYLDTPLYISNRIYDKCIEIKVPAIKYMSTPEGRGELINENELRTFGGDLDIADLSSIKVEYSVIAKSDVYDYSDIDKTDKDVMKIYRNTPDIPVGTTAILYVSSSTVSTLFPQTANSDKIGAYVGIPEGKNYVEFGGTWNATSLKPEPINWIDISQFNVTFRMYDVNPGNVTDLYTSTNNRMSGERTWVGYHELIAKYYKQSGTELDSLEPTPFKVTRYNFTQMFNPTEHDLGNDLVFQKFRPIIDREDNAYGVVFDYIFRLINIDDDVQFIKTASTSVGGKNLADYFNDTVTLDIPVEVPVVYNKIEQVSNVIGNVTNPIGTKYSKVYYSTNDIVLDNNGVYSGDGTYTLELSQSPKNYKFTFRKLTNGGDMEIVDMSDAVYRLYSRDANGNDIIIEPTYSDNMNSAMGEIEFNITINNITRLKAVSESDRFMSILVVNQDNTKYSMFDFTYV